MKPVSPWLNEALVQTLTDLWKDHSATEIVTKISDIHGIKVSRNAVIGRLHRMGLTVEHKTLSHPSTSGSGKVPKFKKPPVEHRAILRFDRVNGNSNAFRLTQSFKSDLPPLRTVGLAPLNISLADLANDQCRYIAGDDHLYCGHPKKDGSSFCVAHHHLCWRKADPIAPKSRHYFGTDFARGTAA